MVRQGGRWLSVMRQGGRQLPVMRQGGRRLSLPSNPLPSSALLRSKSTIGDVVLPKGGNHGPRTHLAGSAATTSLRGAALATRFDAVVNDLQGDILMQHVGLLSTCVGLPRRRLSSTLFLVGYVLRHHGYFLLKDVGP